MQDTSVRVHPVLAISAQMRRAVDISNFVAGDEPGLTGNQRPDTDDQGAP